MPRPDPATLPIEQIIGLMLMPGIRAREGHDTFNRDIEACRAAHVGGVCLFDLHLPTYIQARNNSTDDNAARLTATRNIESPTQTAQLCKTLRNRLSPSLMISVDQEGGKVARLNPLRGFPATPTAAKVGQMNAPARSDAAHDFAATVRAAGFDINFAPCTDAAVNPDNPIIAKKHRAYSDDLDTITRCAAEVIESHTAHALISCIKHFPGHGSSAADTHAGFVDITHTWQADPELAIYQRLIPSLDPARTMVMTGHLFHAGIDKDHPASLSHAHTTGLLRETLGFTGVIVTDSLDMGAITDRYGPDEALVLAINAGADILLDGFNAPHEQGDHPAPRMHAAISKALAEKRIAGGEARLRQSAARILRLRRWTTGDMMPQ